MQVTRLFHWTMFAKYDYALLPLSNDTLFASFQPPSALFKFVFHLWKYFCFSAVFIFRDGAWERG